MLAPYKTNDPSAQATASWSLHYGSSDTVLALVVPDPIWPGMYRIAWPDGRMSDMANLYRIRDAAVVIASRGPPFRNPNRLQFRCYERPANRVLARSLEKTDPDIGEGDAP